MIEIVVATNNAHKVEEINAALSIEGFTFLPVCDVISNWESPVEDADTFEGNAAIKANAVFEACGIPALADDSGLVVDALGGQPGVYSARYAGEGASDADNNAKLLRELDGLDTAQRTARFVSTLVLVGLDKVTRCGEASITTTGLCGGVISETPVGENGFGYDPLFLPSGQGGRSMAQLTMAEKNAISHRGNALAALKDEILSWSVR